MQVDLRTPNTRFPEDVSRALDDNQFRPIWQAISDKSASDEWILSYLDALPEDFYFSSTQVTRVLCRRLPCLGTACCAWI